MVIFFIAFRCIHLFFSSRRRHTRCGRDWSSDVCSSDLDSCNQRNGSFKDVAVDAGIAFSAEGKARAGMGVDVADFENSGSSGVAITNFDNEMIGLYRASSGANYTDVATQSGVGLASKDKLGFGCVFLDADLDGALDLAVVNW